MPFFLLSCLFTSIFVVTYFLVSRKFGSYLNPFTPYFFLTIATKFLLDILFNVLVDSNPEVHVYFQVYLSNTIEFVFLVFGFLLAGKKKIKVRLFDQTPQPKRFYAWAMLILAYMVFLPILIEFKEYILEPREIYIRTRTGYGLFHFLSIMCGYISFVFFLLAKKGSLLSNIAYIVLLIIGLYIHGSKAPIITIFFIYILYLVSIRSIKFNFAIAMRYLSIASALAVTMFALTLPEAMKENFILGIASYSDYNRNMAMVIESPIELQYGRLTFENNFVSLIPRALYEQKPKNFGSFYLSEHYYPKWFEADSGSPAFGMGVAYADFGPLFYPYIIMVSLAVGFLLRVFYNRVTKSKSVGDFIVFLFFAGLPLFNVAVGYPLIPNVIIAVLASVFVILFKRINIFGVHNSKRSRAIY